MPKSVHTDEYTRFLALLAEERNRAGLTQVQLAARRGKPQSFVSKFERGERRLDVVVFRQVAEAIGADPIRLLRKVYRPRDGSK